MSTTKIAPVVWINGFPGCGKLTIASIMKTLHSDMILLDNHSLIDPVEAKFQRSHPDYQKERHLYRQHVFKEHVSNPAKLSQLVVFTDYQSHNALGQKVAEEYREAARQAGRPFKPVYITCDVDENIKRIATSGRVNSSTRKITDPQLLREFRRRCELFRFDDCSGLSIDTTNTTPEEVAKELLSLLSRNED